MRVAVSIITLILLFQPTAPAAEGRSSGHRWLRRITLAASCAASAWDLSTTHSAVGAGGVEGNPLFSGPSGQPRWGRMIAFKAGTCVAAWVAEERFAGRAVSDRFWIGVNTASAGAFAGAALHNRAVAGRVGQAAAAQ